MTRWPGSRLLVGVVVLFVSGTLQAQIESPGFSGSRNTFSVIAEYSNDSSRIIMGDAVNVKLGAIGLQYQRRLIANRHLVWSYGMEFRPVIIESNPTVSYTTVYTSPISATFSSGPEVTGKWFPRRNPTSSRIRPRGAHCLYPNRECSREITYAQGFSPFGMKLNLRTRSRLQPTFSSYEGYILSTRPVPSSDAGSFNFDFEIGAGFEYYRSRRNSIRLEYQIQHYSNHNTAPDNPGVDNGLLKLTYSFGR